MYFDNSLSAPDAFCVLQAGLDMDDFGGNNRVPGIVVRSLFVGDLSKFCVQSHTANTQESDPDVWDPPSRPAMTSRPRPHQNSIPDPDVWEPPSRSAMTSRARPTQNNIPDPDVWEPLPNRPIMTHRARPHSSNHVRDLVGVEYHCWVSRVVEQRVPC